MKMLCITDDILKFINEDIRIKLNNVSSSIWEKTEEIRIFSERHIIIYTNNGVFYIDKYGNTLTSAQNLFVPSHKSLERTVALMCNNSIYSELDNIKNGFITLPHGHRVGIVGTAVLDKDKISYIKSISCINIRIMREVKDFSLSILNHVYCENKIKNTLIISPPQCGKTTLLRDIARTLGSTLHCRKVGIVDERNEIASVKNGSIINDVGIHTFVISNCPKSEGVSILIRTMSPEVIITDEIGSEDDIITMRKALCSGVKIITSVHSGSIEEFLKSEYGQAIKDFFDVFVILSRRNGPGTVESIKKRGEILDC